MTARALLGFDYGEKHIGVAVGYPDTGLAQPLTHIAVRNRQPDWDRITRLIDEWQPGALVVGLPLNMDDSENAMTLAARRFGNQLHGRYNLPVHMVDERLTSVSARNALLEGGVRLTFANKSKVDRLAAQVILQAFLDEQRRGAAGPSP